MRAFVVADGDRPTADQLDAAWPGWQHGIELVVVADGGATLARQLGLVIDAWVGDGDSIPAADLDSLRAAGVPISLSPPDKDESDAELAIIAAVDLGATDLTVLGALGGRRLDHAIANVALLGHARLVGLRARLLDASTRVTLVVAPDAAGASVRHDLSGRPGDVVSLLPFGERVDGITTSGLRYPLRDEPLEAGPARGLSNVRERADAWIDVRRGRLLVVESPATLPR